MTQRGLAIGVLAASTKQLSELNRLIKGAGFEVAASVELRGEVPKNLPAVDVWMVNLDLHDEKCQALLDHLESSGTPVIFEEDIELTPVPMGKGDGEQQLPSELRQRKERRIANTLRRFVRPLVGQGKPLGRARAVWVLAASTGGPEAVAKFLKGMPAQLDGLAFLYAQHIEPSGLSNLRTVVKNSCAWDVQFTDEAQVIRERTIYILSPSHQVELSDGGVISPLQETWQGRYKPSINQVIAKVARVYKNRGGVIVFSGMGDDGADSCTMMHHRGGQVWIQSVDTCTIDSMPHSVAKRGLAKLSAAPQELAKEFARFHGVK